ncbi:MAG: hypothetical protein JSS20_12045 [Proteobacteria bacterium]|nr:hypothetical protein [Pseudomonadota bacterium]
MTEIVSINRQRALQDPETEFHHPSALTECIGLTRGEKIAALERWRFLVGRRVASAGEGMIEHRNDQLSADAELLSELGRELERTKAPQDDFAPAK